MTVTERGRFIEVVEDRSYRNAMESALLKSQEQLRLAIEGSGVGLWDWRVDRASCP
jgi:PAS domain-containing protein